MRPHGTSARYGSGGCRCDLCRQTHSERARLYYLANGEAARAKARASREANPDRVKAFEQARSADKQDYYLANREAILAKHRAYKIANREAMLRRNTAYEQEHRESAAQRLRAWRKANPVRASEQWRARRARERSDACLVTEKDWRRLCARYDNRCAYCGAQGFLERDHVIPLTRGGRHSIGNLLPACRFCNSSKNSKLLVEWRAHRRMLAAVS